MVRSQWFRIEPKINSGNYYHGDWYIPEFFFSVTLDKIFKFTNGKLVEFTDRLSVDMIKSYADFVIEDRNGVPLTLSCDGETKDHKDSSVDPILVEDFSVYFDPKMSPK